MSKLLPQESTLCLQDASRSNALADYCAAEVADKSTRYLCVALRGYCACEQVEGKSVIILWQFTQCPKFPKIPINDGCSSQLPP